MPDDHDATSPLRRRYRALLRAYPKSYRDQRGEEIIGTLLDTAEPGRSRPSLADAADLIAAGVRQRMGLHTVPGLHRGLALAGPLALALVAGLSLFFWVATESALHQVPPGQRPAGPFASLGPVAYGAWLLAVLAPLVVPRLPRRVWVGLALALTLAVPLIDLATPYAGPPWYVLWLLAGLGAVVLLSDVPAPSATVTAGAVGTAVLGLGIAWLTAFGQVWQLTYLDEVIPATSVLCLVALLGTFAVGMTRMLRHRDTDWLWAAAVLLIPTGWMAMQLFERHSGRLLDTVPAYLLLSVAVVAGLVWLASHPRDVPLPTGAVIPRAGATALGCAAGLAGFLLTGHVALALSNDLPVRSALRLDSATPYLYGGWLLVALGVAVVRPGRLRTGLVGVAVAATAAVWLVPRFADVTPAPGLLLVGFALLGVAALAASRLPVRPLVTRTLTAAGGVLAATTGLGFWLDWFQPGRGTVTAAEVVALRAPLTPGYDPAPDAVLLRRLNSEAVLTRVDGLPTEVIQAATLIAAVPLAFAAVILVRALLDRLYRAR